MTDAHEADSASNDNEDTSSEQSDDTKHSRRRYICCPDISIFVSFRALCILLILTFFQFFLWFATRDLMRRSMIELDDSIDTLKIYRHSAHAISFAPWPLPTDKCILRIVNACPTLDRCSRSRLIGYGLSADTSVKTRTTVFAHLQPENRWPWLFESYENRLWCDVVAVLKPNMSLQVYVQDNQISIFAEHVSLDELTVRNEMAAGVKTNVWIQAKNLTISKKLLVDSRLGGVAIEQLVMPTSANASVSISEGSVDILTSVAPRLFVKSQNQAVCIVGEYENLTTSSLVDGVEMNTTIQYALAYRCFEVLDCQQPLWEISCLGLHGSIGVHGNLKAAAPNGSEQPMIYAGRGF